MSANKTTKVPAKIYEYPKDILTGQQDEPVRITERLPGRKWIHTPKGETVIDFGQNLTGVVEFRVKKECGTKIVIRHAEALDEEGNFYTVNLRTAKAADTFICCGEEDFFRPAFTYHGFRYISVEGVGEKPNPADFTACVIHTDLEKTGDFTCSNEAVNRLMLNIDWGLRGNFLDIPTDCPQRDEHLGYTGDAQIFLPAAACLRNVALFFEKWLRDLNYEQSLGAGVPTTVPNILGPGGGIAIWHDAAKVLGREAEAEKYESLHSEILQSIRDEYMTKKGRVISNTQTANVLALHFGIADDKDRRICLKSLLDNLQQHKNHLTTGFAGTPFLCPALSENGAHDIAGTVFLKDDCPSWLYHVKLGATTMWELWDGVNPDGSFNKFEMNSLNHYSYGSIGGWVFHHLLGLSILEPGYKKSRIAPRLIRGIPEMKGFIETVYGTLSCHISCLEHKYTADIVIPANPTAVVSLPEREEVTLGSGTYHFEYETESSFVKERYDMDSKFGELLQNPAGNAMLKQYAEELLENELFMMFAKERPVSELSGMLPPEAMHLMEMVLEQCNANHK